MEILEREKVREVRQCFAEAFGPDFNIRSERYVTGERARNFFARIKEVPAYIFGSRVRHGLLSELSEVDLGSDFVTDQDMIWAYCEDIEETCGLGDDSPGIRLGNDFAGPLPWTDPGESDWYRARDADCGPGPPAGHGERCVR